VKEVQEQGGTGEVRKVGHDGGKKRSGTGGERERKLSSRKTLNSRRTHGNILDGMTQLKQKS
jgi:hypothetical protein